MIPKNELVLPVKVTFSIRPMSGANEHHFGGLELTLEDTQSHVEFLSLKIPGHQLVDLLANLAYRDATVTLRGLNLLGFTRLNDTIHVPLPKIVRDPDARTPSYISFLFAKHQRETAAYDILIDTIRKATPTGWTPNLTFGSRDDITGQSGEEVAHVHIYKFVPNGDPSIEEHRKACEIQETEERAQARKRTKKGKTS